MLTQVSSNKSFGGLQKVFSHSSEQLKCVMKFAVYLPSKAESEKVPLIYWLSGLTCTEQNFITKSGFQRFAASHGFAVVAPDTSPRDCNIEGEGDSYDFGTGAGFYLDATEDKWKKHYRMYSYLTKELFPLVNDNFPVLVDKQSIFGHSMGGHGALSVFLKNPGRFRTVSAFAPISNPIICPWGQKAFSGYLGQDKETWKQYDSTELVKSYDGPPVEILIDQGKADEFLPTQLFPSNFVSASQTNSRISVQLRSQEGYDHSFYFISTFLEDHFRHHAKFLTE